MKLIDNYLIRHGFIKADPVQKMAGFMELETGVYPDGQPDPQKVGDYNSFVRAYRKLPWLYAGVMALSVAITKPPLRVYKESAKKGAGGKVSQDVVEGEPINDLLEQPNDDLTWRELAQVTAINLALSGNAYWNLVGTSAKTPIQITPQNPPVEIWWIKPEQMQPKVDSTGKIIGYIFTGESGREKMLDVSEVIHFRLPNPSSYYLGMGMMEPATNTALLELNSVAYQKNFLESDGQPSMIFEHPGEPTPEARKKFFASWDERHKGAKKAGRAGMIWGGMKVADTGTTMKDAQYTELRKMNREEILATIGVPPSVVGLLEYANYSNMEVQQKKFWEDAAIPLFDIVADKISGRLCPLFNDQYWAAFDYSQIKVLQEDEERRSRIAESLIRTGVKTPNQVRVEMYNSEPYVGGDQYYMGQGLSAVGIDMSMPTSNETMARAEAQAEADRLAVEAMLALAQGGQPGDKPEDEPKGDDKGDTPLDDKEPKDEEKGIKELPLAPAEVLPVPADKTPASDPQTEPAKPSSYWRDPERKAALHQHFSLRVQSRENAMIPLIERYLKKQAEFIKRRASQAGSLDDLRSGDLFDIEKETKLYIEKFMAFYVAAFKRAGAAGYRATKGLLVEETKADDDFLFTPEQLEQLKAQITQSAQYFNATTWGHVEALIEEARLNGLTIEELTQELWQNLSNTSVSKSRLIARTEMTRTENGGQKEGYKQNEFVTKKGWLCMDVPDSRDGHLDADGQEVDLDDDFIVGGEAMEYPGDPRGSAGNVCNCMCTTYPVVEM